jgi:hypothetical protein
MLLPNFPAETKVLDVYEPLINLTDAINWDVVDIGAATENFVSRLKDAVANADSNAIADLCLDDQCHWKDTIALTAHIRAFKGSRTIGDVLKELAARRGVGEISTVPGSASLQAIGNHVVSSVPKR